MCLRHVAYFSGMNIKTRIAARIRNLREEKNLTQEELAWKSDVNRTSMNHVENGRRNISVETLNKIINGFEISFKEFFDDAAFDNGKKRKK